MVLKRDYRMDNIRCILIFLVVFGHLLELVEGEKADRLYQIIYSFHMPAFLFLTGWFARFDRRKIVRSLLCPYLLFQALYLVFDAVVLQGEAVKLQFTKPYWLLWYLLAVLVYHLLLPLLAGERKAERGICMGVLVLVSLLAGFDASIGYYLSFSRILCFAPFFYAGYYLRNSGFLQCFWTKKRQGIWLKAGSLAAVLFCSGYIWSNREITDRMLYGSCSYQLAKYGPGLRLLVMGIAVCWIVFLLVWVTDKKLPFISMIGKNTFSVFLLHGFLVRLAKKEGFFPYGEGENLLLAAVSAVALLLLLGNPWAEAGIQALFGGRKRMQIKSVKR